MMQVNVLRKKCCKCGVEKSVALGFYRNMNPRGDGYMSQCRSCAKRIAEDWRAGHLSEANAMRLRYVRSLRERVLTHLGSKCVHCGFSDARALQIDHVHNDGCKEPDKRKSRAWFFMSVLKDTDGRYQLLCANCNTIKAYEYNQARLRGEAA
jgi:hypothetical protein